MVLSKLNNEKSIDLTVIAPRNKSAQVGEGVYQTKNHISFKYHELDEFNPFGIYTAYRGLNKLLIKDRPDVVIVDEFHLLPFIINLNLVMITKAIRCKLILQSIPFRLPKYPEAKNMAYKETELIKSFPRWLSLTLRHTGIEKLMRLMFLQIMKYAYCHVDAHLIYVREGYEIYKSYGVDVGKIFITYNSPDTDFLLDIRNSLMTSEPILPRCENRLIHVGRLVEWKRVDLLIRAFKRVKENFPDAELLVVGYGPQEQDLKNLCNRLHLSESVKFVGGIYDSRVLGQYLLASSVYVLAGMGGLSINDAMCFGLPVICSVCDGTEKVLVRDGANGKYFKENDEDDLVEKIEYILKDPQMRKNMGMRSLEIIKNEVNIHTVIKGFKDALEYVAGDKKAKHD
jgi:glycosyltransferase involved in cell wall biosynthesis